MIRLVDTHAHLHDRGFDADREAVIARARAAGVTAMITVGTDVVESAAAVALAGRQADIFATVGLHPHDARTWETATERALRALATEPRVVAIGEIGLDYFRNLSPQADQERAFGAQLELASDLRLPVVIHSRHADQETYRVLAAWAPRATCGRPVGVLHCFAGGVDLALRYADLGFCLSIAGPVTYPKNDALRAVAAQTPAGHVVLETDCPYLTPQVYRGRRNEPAFLLETAQYVAGLRGLTPADLAAICADNARRLFRLPVEEEAPV